MLCRHRARGSLCQTPILVAYYQGAQCSRKRTRCTLGAGVLPLITAPVIANIRLYHVLIDDRAGLNVISYAVFKQLQISESKMAPSRPFSGVGPQLVFPLGSIVLPVTFGTEDNFRTENVQFDVAEVNLPSLAGRPSTASWSLPTTGT